MATNWLTEMVDPDSDLAKELEVVEQAAKLADAKPDKQFIVYYVGGEASAAWEYNHNPDDGIPYGRLYGYWDKTDDGSSVFVPHTSNNLKVMPFDTFMDNIIPDKNSIKIFESEADFIIDRI